MSKLHTLYAYVEGHDFDTIAERVTDRFSDFIGTRRWLSGEAWAVNQRRESDDKGGGWELGMNLELPNPYSEPDGWFADIEEIAVFCRQIAEEFQVEFVIGIAENGIADDLWTIDSGAIDIEGMRQMIGDSPP